MVAIYYSTQMADDSCPFRICDLSASCLLIFLKHKQILISYWNMSFVSQKKERKGVSVFEG